MPIGASRGFRVQLGKESKARKQFAARYGREALSLSVFGRGRRVGEGELNANILCNIALEGPVHPYELRARIEANMGKGHEIPDERTFRRHIQELHELGYIKVLKEEPHHAGRKRTYTLTEKGKAVVQFLPEVQNSLLEFLNLHDKADRAATPAGRTIRLLLEKGIDTVAEYIVRATNVEMLRYTFEDEQDEDEVRILRLQATAAIFVGLKRRIGRGEIPTSVSLEDARKFDDALKNDPEFRRTTIDIVQGMKEGIDYFRKDVVSTLAQLRKL